MSDNKDKPLKSLKTLKLFREGTGHLVPSILNPSCARDLKQYCYQSSSAFQPSIPVVLTKLENKLNFYGYTLEVDAEDFNDAEDEGSEDIFILDNSTKERVKNFYVSLDWDKLSSGQQSPYTQDGAALRYDISLGFHEIAPSEFENMLRNSMLDIGNNSDELFGGQDTIGRNPTGDAVDADLGPTTYHLDSDHAYHGTFDDVPEGKWKNELDEAYKQMPKQQSKGPDSQLVATGIPIKHLKDVQSHYKAGGVKNVRYKFRGGKRTGMGVSTNKTNSDGSENATHFSVYHELPTHQAHYKTKQLEEAIQEGTSYIGFHNGKQVDIHDATSLYDAKLKAIKHFKPKKSQEHMVHVHPAEKDGEAIIHTATESVLDESKNPFVSKEWPGKLHRKIYMTHKNSGRYMASNAYKTLKDAKHGYAHHLEVHPDEIHTEYADKD